LQFLIIAGIITEKQIGSLQAVKSGAMLSKQYLCHFKVQISATVTKGLVQTFIFLVQIVLHYVETGLMKLILQSQPGRLLFI